MHRTLNEQGCSMKIFIVILISIIAAAVKSDIPALNEVKHRLSRQFKDTLLNSGEENPSDASIAMSLVDALQKWADALEAQISMMRVEVMDLKTSNRELSNEVSTLRTENQMLKTNFKEVESNIEAFEGETTGIKDDLRVMSTSFSDFLDHFNQHSQTVSANHSQLRDSLANLSPVEDKVATIVTAFSALEDEVKANENRLVQVMADNKALEANVQLILYNASVALFKDVEDLRTNDEAFVADFKNVQMSLGFIQAKFDVIANETGFIKDQVLSSLEIIQTEIEATQEATLEKMKPLFTSLNSTLYNSVGTLQSNVSELKMVQEEMKQDLFRLEAMAASNAASNTMHSNMTMSMQDQLIHLSSAMDNLQGTLQNATTGLDANIFNLSVVASYNSTQLQRGFFSLERHFIEMKREIFETHLQVVSVNASVHSIGDLRTEVMAIGQAMANTTSLVSDRFEDVAATTSALQQNFDIAWNATYNLDKRLTKLETNHTFVTGIVKSSISEIYAKQDEVEWAVKKAANRTLMLESGLAGLMNYSLELDDNVMGVKESLTRVNASLARADQRIEKAYELYELHDARIVENANLIKENVTKLSLAANILEAELSRVASGYMSLKNALSRYVSNAGNVEVNVQKLATENVYVKSELDALRFDMASVKAEATGVSVFVTTMQNHIGSLTSNITFLATNVSEVAEKIVDMKEHMEDLDTGLDEVKSNFSNVMTELNSNTMHMQEIDGNMGTLKSNVLGLGNYINNINSDLGSMLTSFDAYAKKVSLDMGLIKSNVTELIEDILIVNTKSEELKKKFDSVEYSTGTLKTDVTDLTTKMYNMKTAVFEYTNEITALKSSQSGLHDNMNRIMSELESMQSVESVQEVALTTIKADVTALKTGMNSISAGMLELKAETSSMKDMDRKMAVLSTNVTSIILELKDVQHTLSSIDIEVVHSDLTRYKQSVNSLSTKMALMSDPARFSCAVTSDEIRVPGVVTYSTWYVIAFSPIYL